ncbi:MULTISPECIES: SCO family protein [Streptomyces]|uniref:SCO family protein n=1 Tax=Streptomyces chilikensis TaxID=1194079 RepID=A0ABV3ENS8_9ACTN|nr:MULTISPECIES: SCO family protein [Streptomyces]MDH6226121.1 protein SCO1/2 [Streptomyces sp. MJP52]
MRNKISAAAVLLAAALTLSACSSGEPAPEKPGSAVTEVTPDDKAATVLDTPFEKPDLVLTDTHGKEFDLREQTRGRPTLIYFGYTNCPDVCPLTMNNLAVAKKQLPEEQQDELRIVFVTTDPERDTAEELGSWIKGIDTDIIGLTGDFATIQAGARTLGISVEEPVKEKDGTVVSTHGTQVVAFSPKTDQGYVLYGEDTTVDDYTADLPALIKGEKP